MPRIHIYDYPTLAFPISQSSRTKCWSRSKILLKKGPQRFDGRLIESGKISTERWARWQTSPLKETHEDLAKRLKTFIKLL
jgi:hypothetical protein